MSTLSIRLPDDTAQRLNVGGLLRVILPRIGVCSIRRSDWSIGNMPKVSSPWSGFGERIRMIKLIALHYRGNFHYELTFSDGALGIFDGRVLLERTGHCLTCCGMRTIFLVRSSMLVHCVGRMVLSCHPHDFMICLSSRLPD